MAKKISLTSHKNTIERKRKREVAKEIDGMAKFAKDRDVRAYAFVMIDGDGGAHCLWDTGSIIPMWGFASTIYAALTRDIEESGLDETWRPPLPIKG